MMAGTRKSQKFQSLWLSKMREFRCLSIFFVLLVFAITVLVISGEVAKVSDLLEWRAERERGEHFVTVFQFYMQFNFTLQIKTVAGDNLQPTPWHYFKPQTFASWSKYSRASQLVRCSYLSCIAPMTLLKPLKYESGKFQNSSHSCPNFFQWIHEDLSPWRESGITEVTIKSAQPSAAFRVIIVGGRLYVDLYYSCVQSRTMFTIWGLLQLLERYPGMIPDVDFMFDCMDRPKIRRSHYRLPNLPPPPLFRYCSNQDHFEIPFPDWSFWGWPEVNISHWEQEFNLIKMGFKSMKWTDRQPIAYWKGNPNVGSAVRRDLLKCNHPKAWGAEIIQQKWEAEASAGYVQSKLSSQCKHRYKIYAEGSAWSVSFKYILSCDSPVLVISPQYFDFFTRWLMPKEDYWPVRRSRLCPSIKFAVDWGNNNSAEIYRLLTYSQSL